MNLTKNNLFAIAIACAVFVLTAYTVKEGQAEGKKQLLMVEVIFGFDGNEDVSGIYTTKNDGTVSKEVTLVGYVGKENIGKNATLIHKYLKDTYNGGWELASATGGDNAKRYIFRK